MLRALQLDILKVDASFTGGSITTAGWEFKVATGCDPAARPSKDLDVEVTNEFTRAYNHNGATYKCNVREGSLAGRSTWIANCQSMLQE